MSWLCFAIQVTQLVLHISGHSKPIHSKSRSAPAFHNSRIMGCFPFYTVNLGPDVGNLLHLFSFHTGIACSFFKAQSASYLQAKHLEQISYYHPGILKSKDNFWMPLSPKQLETGKVFWGSIMTYSPCCFRHLSLPSDKHKTLR